MNVGVDGFHLELDKSAWGNTQFNVINRLALRNPALQFYVFTTKKGKTILSSLSNLHPLVCSSRRKFDSLSRTRAISRTIKESGIHLDTYLETCEIIPKFSDPVRILSFVHDFSQGTLESRLTVSHFRGMIYRILHIRSIRRADVLFCNSLFTLSQLRPYLNDSQTAMVFPHGCNDAFVTGQKHDNSNSSLQNVDLSSRYFLFVGRVGVKHKNLSLLLNAYSQFSSIYSDVSLVIASTEKLTYSQEKTLLRSKGRIKFLKAPSTSQIIELYKNAIALVFPSVYEGFGIPIIEAQNVGCPLILNDIRVFREVAGDGAFFFDGTAHDLIAKMEFSLIGDNTYKIVGQGKMNCKRYSWDRTTDLISEYLSPP